MTTRILLCQNDDQGNLTDRCQRISFDVNGEIALLLDCRWLLEGEPLIVNQHAREIEIYGYSVPYKGMNTWVGSMAFNMYEVEPKHFLGLANLLMRSCHWNFESGWESVSDRWDNVEELTWEDFELDEPVEPMVIDPAQLKIF